MIATTTRPPRSSVGRIIWTGFGTLFLLMALGAAVSYAYLRLSRASSEKLARQWVGRAALAGEMERTLQDARSHLTGFSLGNQPGAVAPMLADLDRFEQQLAAARELGRAGAGDPVLIRTVDRLATGLASYRAEVRQLQDTRNQIAASREAASTSFENLTRILSQYAAGSGSDALLDLVLLQQVSSIRVSTLQAFADRDAPQARQALARLAGFKRQTADNPDIARAFDDLVTRLATSVDFFARFEAAGARCADEGAALIEQAAAIGRSAMGEVREVSLATVDAMNRATAAVMAGMLVTLLLGFSIALVVLARVRRALTEVAVTTERTARDLADDADHLVGLSRDLAGEAAGQAVMLDQTSHAVAEMTGLTRSNDAVAQKMAAAARRAVETGLAGATDMAEMERAMADITRSSQEVTRIVKTMDEIAFQTNLLALNAAVEAARVGEAGAGFAVVANEVRTLAVKSAEASQLAAVKVTEAAENTRRGVLLSSRAATAFNSVVSQSRMLAEHSAEIASVSVQQRAGLEQVNTATLAMTRATHSGSHKAGETADAAASLHAHVRDVVRTMESLRDRRSVPPAEASAASRARNRRRPGASGPGDDCALEAPADRTIVRSHGKKETGTAAGLRPARAAIGLQDHEREEPVAQGPQA